MAAGRDHAMKRLRRHPHRNRPAGGLRVLRLRVRRARRIGLDRGGSKAIVVAFIAGAIGVGAWTGVLMWLAFYLNAVCYDDPPTFDEPDQEDERRACVHSMRCRRSFSRSWRAPPLSTAQTRQDAYLCPLCEQTVAAMLEPRRRCWRDGPGKASTPTYGRRSPACFADTSGLVLPGISFSTTMAPPGVLLAANENEGTLSVIDPKRRIELAKIPEGGFAGHEVASSLDGSPPMCRSMGMGNAGRLGNDVSGTSSRSTSRLAGRSASTNSITVSGRTPPS